MNQAARIARMKSSAVANHGRRLCRVAAGAQSSDMPSASPQGSAANPDQVSRDGLAATDIPVSDALRLTLRLGAAACGLDEAEFVRRAIAEKASEAA